MTLIERMRDTLEEHQGTGNYCLIDELTEAIAALEAAEKALDEIDKHGVISPHACNLIRIALEAIRK